MFFIIYAFKGYSRKKYLGGEEGKQYIFLWMVGADIFQIIWVIGVWKNGWWGFIGKSVTGVW